MRILFIYKNLSLENNILKLYCCNNILYMKSLNSTQTKITNYLNGYMIKIFNFGL